MTDTWRAALHESGHTTSGYLIRGWTPTVLSIRAGAGHSAITMFAGIPRPLFAGHDPGRPAWDADPALVRDILTRIVAQGLAGALAEDLVPQPGGYVGPTFAERIASVAPAILADLRVAEATPPSDDPASDIGDDAVRAFLMAVDLVGPMRATALVAWLAVETREYLAHHAAAVVAVATELARVGIMPGADAVAIIVREEAPPT